MVMNRMMPLTRLNRMIDRMMPYDIRMIDTIASNNGYEQNDAL